MRDSLRTKEILHPETSSAVARKKAFDPARIIESLPEEATPAQQDSAVQAHLPQRVQVRSTRPDTLNLPGWNVPSARTGLFKLPTYEDYVFFNQSPAYHPEIPIRPFGKTSDLFPYLLRNDNWVTAILFCCFLAVILIFAHSKRYAKKHLQDFFLRRADKEQLSNTETGTEIRHAIFLYLQAGLLAGLIFFDYTQASHDLFMAQVSSHMLLSVYVVVFWVFLGVKQLLYAAINWVFFNKPQRKAWMKSYSYLVSGEGILFFPLALVLVYFNVPAPDVVFYAVLLLIFMKLLLFYKTFCIFFHSFYGLLHLIVYFCALEILPICGLWQALTYINDILL